jgi:hypothetical protein
MKFIPIGDNCVIAHHLSIRKLRNESYPFDWSCSNILSIVDFIKSNHDNTQIVKSQSNVYPQFVNPELYWPHHEHDLMNEYCYNYVNKCWSRLNKILNSDDKVLFINFTPLSMIPNIDSFIQFKEIINNLYPNLTFEIHLLYFKVVKDDECIEHETLNDLFIHCFNTHYFWSTENNDWSGNIHNEELWDQMFKWLLKTDH